MPKPTSKPAWVSDDGSTKIKEPTGSKKLSGWLKNEKPPFNYLNWLFNILSHWLNYHAGQAQYNIIIDSDSDEADYSTLAAYIADSPAAGDRVLIKVDETLTATLSIPAGIELTQLKGKKFSVSTNFSPIIQFGNNVKTKGDFRLENSDTGTIAKAFSLNGDDNHHDNLILENKSTGTITDAIYLESGAEGNCSKARSINSGAGSITNDLTDNSGNNENNVIVHGDAAISRSLGAKRFNTPTLLTPIIASFVNAQHDHSNAAQGSALLNSIRDKYRNLDIIPNSTNPTYQVDIDIDEIILQDSSNVPYRADSVNLTADITASGANGLDTGSEAASTWYYIWVIWNGTTVAALLSTSSTAPTMPGSYTFKALVGAVYNNSGSDFDDFQQHDNRVIIDSISVLSLGTQTTYTSVDLSAVIPVIANAIGGTLENELSGSGVGNVSVVPLSDGKGEKLNSHEYTEVAAQTVPFTLLIMIAQTIYYKVANQGRATILLSEFYY
jgi:hypothetical protein